MYKINEESTYESLYSNEDIIEKLGEVDVYDHEKNTFVKKNVSDIIKVCSDAMYKMQRDYNYLYQFITKCKLMYIPVYPSSITNTMAVDNNCNLWMNLTFIYDDCKMNSDRVFGILFHELFHIFFDHLLRFQKVYPAEMFASAGPGVYKKANTKANLCMDYEVNASMVDDGIVSPDFFTKMNGLYKKEYTGMTWEEILKKYGDREYNDWLARNGMSLDDVEKKILDAIEKASKILLDPESDEDDKRWARKELRKTLDELLGKKETDGEKSLQDVFDDLAKTKLADSGEIAIDLDDISEDLNKNPEKMSSEELDKTLRDMGKLMDDIIENADEIGRQFNKTSDDVASDAEKARNALKDAMKKINEGGLTKDEKRDLMDKAKDALEDIISDDVEKDKLKEKRAERDRKKEAERLERLKKSHPLRKLIVVMKNLAELYQIGLVSEKTVDVLNSCIDDLELLTEKSFGDMKKSDLRNIAKHLEELKDILLPDLGKLIEDETILQKTEDDMKELLDGVFEHVANALKRIFDPGLDDDAKGSLIKMAAQKLRIIGKVLKTQKKWRVGDDFKDGYVNEMKRLMQIRKDGGDEALMKELIDKGVVNPMMLDKHGVEVYEKVTGDEHLSEVPHSSETHIAEPIRMTDIINQGGDSDIEPYDGVLYYSISTIDGEEGTVYIDLSDEPDYLKDDFESYASFAMKFEKDFPEYSLAELMEAVFEVHNTGTWDFANIDEVKKKVEAHSDYKKGEWGREE